MASIVKESNGRRRIEETVQGVRRRIRLGKVSEKHANTIRIYVEDLAAAANRGAQIGDKTADWIETIDDLTHRRLEKAGLVKPRTTTARTLKAFLDDAIATYHVKESTKTIFGNVKRNLIGYFGESEPLAAITPERADKFRTWLKDDQKLAGPTISSRIRRCRQFFKRAVKWKIIRENPFADVKAGGETNPHRWHFVTRDVAQKVIDACPDAEWRLIFALSRWGGFRCPTEHLALRWCDIDWKHGTMKVHSAKKEGDKTGGVRIVPIFEELEPYLRDARELAPDGAVYVIHRHRGANVNLRTQLLRIIDKAAVAPWPKLFQNLRATRETELAETFPIHVVCAWIGNSVAVASKHYLQVRDEDIRRARGAARNAAHSPAIGGDQAVSTEISKMPSQSRNEDSRHGSGNRMGHTGREHPGESPGKPGRRGRRGALNGAVDPRAGLIEPQSDAEAIARMETAQAVIKSAFDAMLAGAGAGAGRGSR